MVEQRLMDGLVNELGQLIDYHQTPITYPWIGIIKNTTSSQYADIEVEGKGLLKDVPCHGIPEVGDSVIIHFIEGKYEMPVADCPKRLPPKDSTLMNYYQEETFNILDNGDFHLTKKTHEGTYEIIEGESCTITSENCALLSEQGIYLETEEIDLTSLTGNIFKFQAYYTGNGQLQIECFDNETNQVIKTLPYNMRYDKKIWTNPYGRCGWSFNKEIYPIVEDDITHNKIKIRITNVTEAEEIILEDTVRKTTEAMLVDALLVYSENGDTEYYPSVNDIL